MSKRAIIMFVAILMLFPYLFSCSKIKKPPKIMEEPQKQPEKTATVTITPTVTPTPAEAKKEEENKKIAKELENIIKELFAPEKEEKIKEKAKEIETKPGKKEEKGESELLFSLNFEDATISEFVSTIAEYLGFSYVLSPDVGEGTVTIRMPEGKKIKKSDLMKVLNTVLELNGLVAVDAGPYYKILPAPESKYRPIPLKFGTKEIGEDDTVVTQIIPLKYLYPDDILNLINPFISPDATVVSYNDAKLLIITDLNSNIEKLVKIIELLDVETSKLEMEIFKIKYADVEDITSVLDRIYSSEGKGRGPAVARGRTQRAGARRRGAVGQTYSIGGTKEVIIIPDLRSNSIIVFAQRKDLEFIREIIAMLDVNVYTTQKTYIYYVENAEASELASLLEQIYSQPTTRRRAPTRRGGVSGAVGTQAAGLEGEVRIVADDRTNSLIIVTAPVNYPYILKTIKKLDIKPKQVLIEVLIVDVELHDNMQFGVEWTLKNQGEVKIGGEKYYFDGTSAQSLGISENKLGFTYTVFEASRFLAFLRAYAQHSKLEVLSNPHILVANNTEASIEVGNEIPIVTAETTFQTDITNPNAPRQSFNRTIQYRSTGIILNVTPHINEERFVLLDISQEVSNVSANTIAGIDSPVIETRRASTTVMVKDGQTLVIGGMIRRTNNPSQEGIPFLSKIPIIGKLFGTYSKTNDATELLIFLTPHVIATPEEGQQISIALRQRIDIEKKFFEKDFLQQY